jgi:hypothetical protein
MSREGTILTGVYEDRKDLGIDHEVEVTTFKLNLVVDG